MMFPGCCTSVKYPTQNACSEWEHGCSYVWLDLTAMDRVCSFLFCWGIVGERRDPPETGGQKNLYHQVCSATSRALNEVWQGMMMVVVVMMILTRNRALWTGSGMFLVKEKQVGSHLMCLNISTSIVGNKPGGIRVCAAVIPQGLQKYGISS